MMRRSLADIYEWSTPIVFELPFTEETEPEPYLEDMLEDEFNDYCEGTEDYANDQQ